MFRKSFERIRDEFQQAMFSNFGEVLLSVRTPQLIDVYHFD